MSRLEEGLEEVDPEPALQYLPEGGLLKSRSQTTPNHPLEVFAADLTEKERRMARLLIGMEAEEKLQEMGLSDKSGGDPSENS